MPRFARLVAAALGLFGGACTASPDRADGGVNDAGAFDAGVADAGVDDAGPDLEIVEGGSYDGWVTLAGTLKCEPTPNPCEFPAQATRLLVDGINPWQATFHGVVSDAGPGESTVSADGGALRFRWPSVPGHVVATPGVGEEIEVRADWFEVGEASEVLAIEVVNSVGRVLVSQGEYLFESEVFALSNEPTGPTCTFPVPQQYAECCCTKTTPVRMAVRSDTPTALAACTQAVVLAGGEPMYVEVLDAARGEPGPCAASTEDGEPTYGNGFSAVGIALVE